MSRVLSKAVTRTLTADEDVTETIRPIWIDPSPEGNIVRWRVIDLDSNNIMVGTPRFYNYPANDEDLIGVFHTEADTTYEDIKNKLWDKIDEIEAMPETTQEEIEEKAKFKGQGFRIQIG